ncbi:MAG: response regulator [Planctomycetota bacterium]
MLVLARNIGEKLVFPTIGVTIEVLRVKGKTARLGIEAPSQVTVLRGELAEKGGAIMQAAPPSSGLSHALRNRLNAASLALRLYQRQLERGLTEAAESTLEKVIAEFSAVEREAAEVHARSKAVEALVRHKTLLVEDDSNECELLAGFLRLSGFEVATANDGSDALDYLKSHDRPDVVLLDMFMPRCNGPATLEAIRCDPKLNDMKVIAISGTAPAELGVAIGPQGIDRWFPKPVNPEILVRELNRELSLNA